MDLFTLPITLRRGEMLDLESNGQKEKIYLGRLTKKLLMSIKITFMLFRTIVCQDKSKLWSQLDEQYEKLITTELNKYLHTYWLLRKVLIKLNNSEYGAKLFTPWTYPSFQAT